MLVTSEDYFRPNSQNLALHDNSSLTRAKLSQLDQDFDIEKIQNVNDLERRSLNSNLNEILEPITVSPATSPIKRGLLWQQKERLFSRWKERYFILTKDYLNCFKKSSGPANERISEMGQFMFKVKLVDVEKLEWLKKKSYNIIGLVLAREGRVLLRCEHNLEDWYEMIQAFTIVSKKRQEILKITQVPRTRASLAAAFPHELNQLNGHRGTCKSVMDNFEMFNHNKRSGGSSKQFIYFDSVPDLTVYSSLTKPQYSNNASYCSNDYGSRNSSFSNEFFEIPDRLRNNKFEGNNIAKEDDEIEVELRKPFYNTNNKSNNDCLTTEDWMYQKPKSPDRHSVQTFFNYSSNEGSNNDLVYAAHRRSNLRLEGRNSLNHSTNNSIKSTNWNNRIYNNNNNNSINEIPNGNNSSGTEKLYHAVSLHT